MNAKTPAQGQKFQPPIHLEIDPNEDLGIDSPRRQDAWERLGEFIEENRGKFQTLLLAAGITIAGTALHYTPSEATMEADRFVKNPANRLDVELLFEKSSAQLREEAKGGNGSAGYYACCKIVQTFKESQSAK